MEATKTIPEILFDEFSEGEVYSDRTNQWAQFTGAKNIILVLWKQDNGSILRLKGALLKDGGKYDDNSSLQFAEIREGWQNAGIWAYGKGYEQKRAVRYEIRYYYGLEMTSQASDAALAVMNRAQELTREYVADKRWSGTSLERP